MLDANLIRKTPNDRRRRGSSSAVVTTESETPEWAPPRDGPRRRQQLGAEMHTEKPQQPGRNSDLKFFDLFVGITGQMSRAPRPHDRTDRWARRLHFVVIRLVEYAGATPDGPSVR